MATSRFLTTRQRCPKWLFEFLQMPFGLKNAGMSFQQLMDRVMAGLPFVFVYIDDILVASPDAATHLEHLRAVFQRLQQAGLQLNVAKCSFSRGAVDFLGHRISAAGSRPLADKVVAITKHPLPNTVRELQQFLGMLNFYRRFLPSGARLLARSPTPSRAPWPPRRPFLGASPCGTLSVQPRRPCWQQWP